MAERLDVEGTVRSSMKRIVRALRRGLRIAAYFLTPDMPAGYANPALVKQQANRASEWASTMCCRR